MKQRGIILWLALALGGACFGADEIAHDFNIGFSIDFFEGINQDDAIAAMKVWSESVASNRGKTMNSTSTVFKDREQMAEALREGSVDLVIVLSPEMIALRNDGLVEPMFVSLRNGKPAENYLLLAHRDSDIRFPADLGRKSIAIQSNARASMGSPWLEQMMVEYEHGGIESGFSSVTRSSKLSKVVLPVFFKKTDVCLATRNGFNTLTEFNPQLARELVVVAESPDFVPTTLCFRKGYAASVREDVEAGLAELHQEPRGQQVLMLFKVDSLAPYKESLMKNVELCLAAVAADPAPGPQLAEKQPDSQTER